MRFKQLDWILHITPSFIIIVILFSSLFNLIEAQISNEKPIGFSVNIWAPNFLVYVAQEKGYFEKNNVNVNLTLIQDYADAVRDYSNGEYDGMFIVYSDALIQDSEGIDTKVIYNTDTSYDADPIIGNVDNITDIKGKKVGVEGINSFSHYFMLTSLGNVGLGEGDVEFLNIPAQNISEALKKGEIDAGHTYNPYLSDALKDGFKILSTGADSPGVITTVIAFHSDIVKQRPQDIQNTIKSLIEAKEDYDKNKEQDIEIMSLKTGINKTKVADGMNGAKLLDLDYNAQISMNKKLNQSESLYNSGNSIAKFYAERGVISQYPNIEDLLEPKFINQLLMEKN
jgi:NitT/TauT family transport system substrate-binding protein